MRKSREIKNGFKKKKIGWIGSAFGFGRGWRLVAHSIKEKQREGRF